MSAVKNPAKTALKFTLCTLQKNNEHCRCDSAPLQKKKHNNTKKDIIFRISLCFKLQSNVGRQKRQLEAVDEAAAAYQWGEPGGKIYILKFHLTFTVF